MATFKVVLGNWHDKLGRVPSRSAASTYCVTQAPTLSYFKVTPHLYKDVTIRQNKVVAFLVLLFLALSPRSAIEWVDTHTDADDGVRVARE